MNFIDLFAGIGGIRMAFENAGFNCVFSNEIDEKARITYDLNFKNNNTSTSDLVLADIRDISSSDIPDFDVLTAGFPCQPFSIAGFRQGFDDEQGRGNLFYEIVRILRDKQPRSFLLENVKNLKSHDNGNTMKVILRELESELGYKVKYAVLNTMEYGNLPQNRERIYIVGFKELPEFNSFDFPNKIPLTKTINDCLEKKEVEDKYYYNDKPLYNELKKKSLRKILYINGGENM